MNNELVLFNNSDFGDIRTLKTPEGKILFCGKDVASVLGYKDARHAISAHCRYGVKCTVPHPQNPDKEIYGITILDTAKNGKQVPNFRYNENGIKKLRELLSA